MKEERIGWEWIQTKTGGFWSKVSGPSHKHKKDFFCPCCKIPTGTIDDKFLSSIGICSKCYVEHLESRKVPTIDITKYQKFDLSNFDLSKREFLKILEKENF